MNHIQWRITNNVADITAASCPNEIRKDVARLFGWDKMGRPLVTVLAGRHDKNNRDIGEIFAFIVWLLDSTIKESNPETETLSIVFDLSSFSLRCMDFEAVKLLIDILQANYPEVRLKYVI